jgi:hypothetical protein
MTCFIEQLFRSDSEKRIMKMGKSRDTKKDSKKKPAKTAKEKKREKQEKKKVKQPFL